MVRILAGRFGRCGNHFAGVGILSVPTGNLLDESPNPTGILAKVDPVTAKCHDSKASSIASGNDALIP